VEILAYIVRYELEELGSAHNRPKVVRMLCTPQTRRSKLNDPAHLWTAVQ
jgi:hypothetical protein